MNQPAIDITAFKSIIDHMELSETNVTELVPASFFSVSIYTLSLKRITGPENHQSPIVRSSGLPMSQNFTIERTYYSARS
jgi:hypothetical protein